MFVPWEKGWKHDGSVFWKLDVWPIIPIFAARNLFGCGIQTHEMNYGFHLHPHQWSLHLRLLKSKPRTTIIIAHRPSRNAVFADSIDSPANLSITLHDLVEALNCQGCQPDLCLQPWKNCGERPSCNLAQDVLCDVTTEWGCCLENMLTKEQLIASQSGHYAKLVAAQQCFA